METKIESPKGLSGFMYMLMDNARRDSFVDLCENYGIDYDTEYQEIKEWFAVNFGISL